MVSRQRRNKYINFDANNKTRNRFASFISLLIDIFPLMKKKMVYYIYSLGKHYPRLFLSACMPVSLLRSQTRWAEIDLLVICKDAGRPHQVMSRDRAAWYAGAIGMQSAWAPNKSFTVTDGGEHIRVMHVHFPKRERSRYLCAASGMGRFDPAHSFRVPVGVNPIRDRYYYKWGRGEVAQQPSTSPQSGKF